MLIFIGVVFLTIVSVVSFNIGVAFGQTKSLYLSEDRREFFAKTEAATELSNRQEIESYLLKLDTLWVRARKDGDKYIQMESGIEKVYKNNRSYFDMALSKLGYKAVDPWDHHSRISIVPVTQNFWNS